MGPPRVAPNPEEALAIKRRCAEAIVAVIPAAVAKVIFATNERDEWNAQAEDWLSCLDDGYMNKAVVFGIIEVVVVRLMPELGEKGVVEMMADRLG